MKVIDGKKIIQEEVPDILYDESRYMLGTPERIYYPETKEDICAIVQAAVTDSTAITCIGGQTGLTGGAVPSEGCYAICFSRMHKILRVALNDNNVPILFCQPGVTLEEVNNFLVQPDSIKYPIDGIEKLSGKHWFYPPDPTEQSAQLGGTVATNASGARSYKFGATRNHIESLSLILSNGESVTVKRNGVCFQNENCTFSTDQGTTISLPRMHYRSPSVKNASGYYSADDMDVIDLFIGSEGTLGIFSEIGIRLSEKLKIIGGLSFFPDRLESLQFAEFLRGKRNIAAIEYFDTTALDFIQAGKEAISLPLPAFPEQAETAIYWEFIETADDSFVDQVEEWDAAMQKCGSAFETTWSGFDEHEMAKLKVFRHAIPELINLKIAQYKKKYPHIRKISTDSAVPRNKFKTVFYECINLTITKNNFETVIFGHLGDNHLHFNILPHSAEEFEQALSVYKKFMEIVIAQGGTISAEHGIGKMKADYLKYMFSSEVRNEMENIKKILDPAGLLNPGNLFGPEH